MDHIASHRVNETYLNKTAYIIGKGKWAKHALEGIKTRAADLDDQATANKRFDRLAALIRAERARHQSVETHD